MAGTPSLPSVSRPIQSTNPVNLLQLKVCQQRIQVLIALNIISSFLSFLFLTGTQIITKKTLKVMKKKKKK
jgi:hypothetical protein